MIAKRAIQIAAPAVGDDEWQAIREPLLSGWLTQGPAVKKFETQFACQHRVEHALATTSCTTALHLALTALGVGPGDEVIVPAFTWVATANVVLHCGATPVFVDVLRTTYNLDPDAVSAACTDRTKAIIPVHLFGLCADMDAIRRALLPHVRILEDAACAVGASYGGIPAGGLGDVGCFSFHPRKTITTGEGGMLTTNDAELAERAERLRNHGASVPEEDRHRSAAPHRLPAFDELGFNYRMTDLQAAVGLVQLAKLETFLDERRALAARYDEALSTIPWLSCPVEPPGYEHGWQSYVALVDPDAPVPRNDLMDRLFEQGISTRPGTHAVPDLGLYRGRGAFPVATMLEGSTLALPFHNRLSKEDQDYVIDAIRLI